MFRGPIVTFGLFGERYCVSGVRSQDGANADVNQLLGLLLAVALVALGVLAYVYYKRTRTISLKVDITGVSGEITKEGVDIDKPKN